jgi:hypothetical protein
MITHDEEDIVLFMWAGGSNMDPKDKAADPRPPLHTMRTEVHFLFGLNEKSCFYQNAADKEDEIEYKKQK